MTGKTVLVIGDGILADFVCRQLGAQASVLRAAQVPADVTRLPHNKHLPPVTLALILHDAWHPAIHAQADWLFREAGIPWLRGFVSFAEGVVGPLVRPALAGCSQCADMRRLMAGSDRPEMWDLLQRLTLHGGAKHASSASQSGLFQLSQLITAEVGRVWQDTTPLSEGHLYLLNLKTLQVSRHRTLPDPLCPVCANLPADSPELARIRLQPSPKIGVGSYRCRPMEQLQPMLLADYLDYQTGLLNGKVHDLVSPFATASVNLPLWNGDEGCAGRTHSYAQSEITAILEGLERYCGLAPRGKRTVVHDSYRNLGHVALHPATVGLHAPACYEEPDFPYQPFDATRPIDWVWGYSFLRDCPVLVPLRLAYYSLPGQDGFVYETSNGCALGGSLTEAIFYGLLEVVERDAFLLTWYAQLPLPRLTMAASADAELQLLQDGLRTVAGYEVHLFNATMENGLPSIWAIAKNQRDFGVNLICAAGAHVDAVRAAKGAIHELAGMVRTLNQPFADQRSRCEQMYADDSQVRQMEDHSLLYSLPEAAKRLDFLLNGSGPSVAFADAFPIRPWHTDLTDDLQDILAVFRRLQLDVIVVNQTSPEIEQNGLHCVKVLIPGMLPMTFGHHLTRLEGLDRVLTVPMKLGYTSAPLTRSQLNPHPHPFP